MIKITGGFLKGRYINSIDGDNTRPTSSKVRESIFNILGDRIIDSLFLDLFAGTGLVGIEAISRGASKSFLVEKDFSAYKILKKNLTLLNIENNTELHKTNANDFLRKSNQVFDLIYIDPPYRSNCYEETLKIIYERADIIHGNGIIIIEHGTKIPISFLEFDLIKTYKYGDTSISLIKK